MQTNRDREKGRCVDRQTGIVKAHKYGRGRKREREKVERELETREREDERKREEKVGETERGRE